MVGAIREKGARLDLWNQHSKKVNLLFVVYQQRNVVTLYNEQNVFLVAKILVVSLGFCGCWWQPDI